MKTLLIEGFSDAFRNLGAALRLFWPHLALFAAIIGTLLVVGNFQYKSNFSAEPLLSLVAFILIIGLTVYLFLILCQGAVGWHRRLLLNEEAHWLSPIPRRRSLHYALPAFLFSVVTLAVLALAMFLSMQYLGSWLLAKAQELNLMGNPSPTIEQLDAFRRATIPINLAIQLCLIAVMSAILWGGRSWLLVFPHVSVRNHQPAWGAMKGGVTVPAGFVRALLVALFLPSVLSFLFQSGVPITIQLMPSVSLTVFLVSLAVSVLSFLTGLSILSLAYSKAVPGKVD